MNRILSGIACAIVAAALPIAALAQSAASSEARVIVKLKPSSRILAQADASTHAGRAERAQALGQRAGVALAAGPAISDSVQVVTATGMSADELALRLA